MEAKIAPGAPQDVEKWSQNFSGAPPAKTGEFFFAPGGARTPPGGAKTSCAVLDPVPEGVPKGSQGGFWGVRGGIFGGFRSLPGSILGRFFGDIFAPLPGASRRHCRELLPTPEAFRQLFSDLS